MRRLAVSGGLTAAEGTGSAARRSACAAGAGVVRVAGVKLAGAGLELNGVGRGCRESWRCEVVGFAWDALNPSALAVHVMQSNRSVLCSETRRFIRLGAPGSLRRDRDGQRRKQATATSNRPSLLCTLSDACAVLCYSVWMTEVRALACLPSVRLQTTQRPQMPARPRSSNPSLRHCHLGQGPAQSWFRHARKGTPY